MRWAAKVMTSWRAGTHARKYIAPCVYTNLIG